MLHVFPCCDFHTVMAWASSREFCSEYVVIMCTGDQELAQASCRCRLGLRWEVVGARGRFLLRRLMAEARWVLDLDNSIGLWQTCALNGANDSTSVPWLVAMLCPEHGSANS